MRLFSAGVLRRFWTTQLLYLFSCVLFCATPTALYLSFATFWRWGPPKMGPMTMKFEIGRFFCTVHIHLAPLNRSAVIVLTNKQTNREREKERKRDSVEDMHLARLCYAGGEVMLNAHC